MQWRWSVLALALAIGAVASADEGLVAHWDFSEGKGDVLHDVSGNENHGKIHGAKWIKNGSGYALHFDGADDWVDCGAGPSLNLQTAVSMEAWTWFESQSTRPEPLVVGKSIGSYAITRYGGSVYTYISGGGYHGIQSAVPNDEWHHLVSTYDGKLLRLYIDGQLANERVLDEKVKRGERFCIAKTSYKSASGKVTHLKGKLTDVRVYDRAFTSEEVLNHFRTTNVTNAVLVSAVPVPWQHRIVADVNVRGLGQRSPDLAVAVTVHKRARADEAEGRALLSATATTFDAFGLASISLAVPKLAPGDYVVRAAARDAVGKPVGLPDTADITWAQPAPFPRGPEGARQLNNFVTELLNVAGPDPSGKAYAFTNPRTGWVFISNDGDRSVTLVLEGADKPQSVSLRDHVRGTHEAMRYLPEGPYRVRTALARNLIVRAIPHLVFDSYHSVPKIKQFGPYVGAFQREHVFKNINTFVGSRGAKEQELRMWKDYGKNWLIHCNVLHDKPNKPVSAEDAYQYLVSRKAINNAYVDGLIADEYGSSTRCCDPWAEAVDRFFSEPKYRDKIYVPFAGSLWNGEPGRKLARAVFKHNGAIAMKSYLKEQRTEAAAWRFIHQYLVDRVRGYRDKLPGSVPHLVICFGWHLCAPTESIDSLPHVNFKTYIESQLNLVANHPVFENIGGVMTYTAGYADEETVRWSMRIFRHYGIEGKTGMLSKDPYILTHIENPDFEMGGHGWTLSPAVKGSIRFDAHAGFAHLAQRYPRTSDGTNVIVTRRRANKPNTFSQEIRNLEPGRLYNLRMFSGDFKNLSRKQRHAVSVAIEGATSVRKKCFTAVFHNHRSHRFAEFGGEGKQAWMNYHWRVFRAEAPTARLTISDWPTPGNPGGPIGQELMYNFIQIQPYLGD